MSVRCSHVLVLGQSEGIGANAMPALTTTQAYLRSRTFIGGVRASLACMYATKPLIEETDSYGETVCSGSVNWQVAARAARGTDPNGPYSDFFFASTAAVGGQPLSTLEKYGDYYQQQVAHVCEGWKRAQELGATAYDVVSPWLQGQTDVASQITRASYSGRLIRFQQDFSRDASAATGLNLYIPFLILQVPYRVAFEDDIALAQFDVCATPGFYFVGPMYVFPHSAVDLTHMTNVGQAWCAAYTGRADDQRYHTGAAQSLEFVCATANGTDLCITLKAPTLPLQFNTTDIAAATDYGVKVQDDLGAIALSSPTISGSEVHFTLARATLPSLNPRVRYALDYLASGVNILDGASGNICDSTPDSVTISGSSYSMFHWLRHLDEPVVVMKP